MNKVIASRKFHVKAWKRTLHMPINPYEEELKKYEEEVDERNKLQQELRGRLEESVQVDSW